MEEFLINANAYLKISTRGYYTLDYRGGMYDESTRFIRCLKNLYGYEKAWDLDRARRRVKSLFGDALSTIIEKEKLDKCTVVAVPRAKALDTYLPTQLYLIDAISDVAKTTDNVIDGTKFITRHTNTKTTHLGREIGRKTRQGPIYSGENANDGKKPYIGITKDTCYIDEANIRGQTIILVDDIYTESIYVDEDCIQALYDALAKEVIFYALAKTTRS